jgi:hypothetical protein
MTKIVFKKVLRTSHFFLDLFKPPSEAVTWVLQQARYSLAKGLLAAGQVEEAMQAMKPLFTPSQGRRLFALNMRLIQDRSEAKVRRLFHLV